MADIKDKVVTVESLSALHEYNKETYMSTTTITIPAGRMRGDINGNGYFDDGDIDLVGNHISGTNIITDETQLLCADINNDGNVDDEDLKVIMFWCNFGFENYPELADDIFGNWECNPEYNAEGSKTEDMMFYTDITINNMEQESNSVIITIVDKNYDKNFFYATCVNGTIRLYAKFPPASEVNAIVQYWNGNGTNVVVVDSLYVIADSLHGTLPMVNGGTNASNGADGLANLLADGKTVLSSYQYGDTLPEAGTVGRIFFKKISE